MSTFMLMALFVVALIVQDVEMTPPPQANFTSHSRVKRDGGAISAAVIGGIFSLAGSSSEKPSSGSGDKGGCRWYGEPSNFRRYCKGECPDPTYEEIARASTSDDPNWENKFQSFLLTINVGLTGLTGGKSEELLDGHISTSRNGRPFGKTCNFGDKALCCKSKTGNNLWNGKWEDAQDNDILRCDAYEDKGLECGLKLECRSSRISNKAGKEFVWSFAVFNAPKCKSIRTIDLGSFNNCEGSAHGQGFIAFGKQKTEACSKFFENIKWFKVE